MRVLVAALLVAIGYVLAVMVASAVVVLVFTIHGLLSGVSLPETPFDPVIWWVIGCIWTGSTALPGFLLTVALSLAAGWRHPAFFVAAGMLDVFPAFWLLGAWAGGSAFDMPPPIFAASFPGGAAGGLVYWLVAGRRLSAPAR